MIEFELVVECLQVDLLLDERVKVDLVGQVAKVEYDLGVLVAGGERRGYVVAQAEQLGYDRIAARHQSQQCLPALIILGQIV